MMKRNKKRNRFLAVLLTLSLLFSMIPISASAYGFSDIFSSYTYLDAVNYVSDNGIMTGTSPTKFNPNLSLTRGMAVTALYRKAGEPFAWGSNSFSDVSPSDYFYDAVNWAVEEGITNGTSSTKFSPHKNLTREDATVFLYRYSKKTVTAVNKSKDISWYSDYSSVSSYARDAMRWAISNGILETPSGYLSPKATMTRIQLANAIYKFGTNVERIVTESDRLGIINSDGYFTSEEYYMTKSHVNKLKNYFNTYKPNLTSAVIDTINNPNKKFAGSCYGMSVVTILDKYGKIAFNENFSNENQMYNITDICGKVSESAINYYHKAQGITGYGGRTIDTVSQMDVCKRASGPVLLSYFWGSTDDQGFSVERGHTVIVNSCTQSGSTYTLKIINPNDLKEQTATLTSGGVLTIKGKTTYLYQLAALDIFSTFNKIDIDSYKNSYSAAVSSANTENEYDVSANMQDNNYSTLMVDLIGEFTIRNSSGEYLTWDSTGLNGNMEIYNTTIIPNGEDYPASMYIDVPVSDTFTFQNAFSNDIWFSVSDQYRYARISGSGVEETAINNQGVIKLSGKALEFNAAYRNIGAAGHPEPTLFTLDGSGSGNIVVERTDEGMEASGISGECTVTEVNDYGETIDSFQIISQPEEKESASVDISSDADELSNISR